jgi:hypothetical protein
MVNLSKQATICKLNDQFRSALGAYGKVLQTPGIRSLTDRDQSAVREQVETFSNFTEDNDPYGEHDFGSFEQAGHTIFWKIDYYERGTDYQYGSPDPADSSITERVLTIMLAEEY